jgi:glycine cleavage system H lipoate-binding protein/TusA-related sulfurtransferase
LRIEHCEYPDGLLYDVEQGTWAEPRGDVIRVGITSLLSFSFGVFSAVTFRSIGMPLGRGQVMGTMEGARHFDVFRSPVAGTLSAVNERLVEEPWLLNRDPYGEGWFAEIRVAGEEETRSLGRLPEAKPRIAQLLKERHVHCYAAFPDFEIFDTGVECQAVLAKLNDLIGRSTPGTVVLVVSDDSSADIEMERWSDQTGNSIVDRRKEGNLFHFVVRKEH